MRISGAQFHRPSSVHCAVCSPPKSGLLPSPPAVTTRLPTPFSTSPTPGSPQTVVVCVPEFFLLFRFLSLFFFFAQSLQKVLFCSLKSFQSPPRIFFYFLGFGISLFIWVVVVAVQQLPCVIKRGGLGRWSRCFCFV